MRVAVEKYRDKSGSWRIRKYAEGWSTVTLDQKMEYSRHRMRNSSLAHDMREIGKDFKRATVIELKGLDFAG